MSDSNTPPPAHQRRKSFVEMLNPGAFRTSTSSTSSSIAIPPSPGATNNNNNRKSMSMALGLSGPANSGESPYNAFARQRRASISNSSTSETPEFRNSFDSSAVIEDDDKVTPMNSPPSPSFARRLSFGARALQDVRQSGTSPSNSAGRQPSSSLLFTLNEDSDNSHGKPAAPSPGTAKTRGEGFNWSDAMRDRNKRSSAPANPFPGGHRRSVSFSAPAPEPPKEMPTQPPALNPPGAKIKKPDHLGERMLRGDFMMD